MKHLLVTNDFPPKIGGIQSLLWEWWRRLPPESFAVLTSPYAGTAEFDAAEPYRIERTREPVLLPHPWMVKQVNELASDFGADFVVLDPAVPLGLIGPSLDLPYRLVLHGAEVTVPGRLPGARQALAYTLGRAEGIIAAGGYPAAEAEHAAGRDLPITVVPCGVDPDRFHPLSTPERLAARVHFGLDADAEVIVGISRLVPRKGFDTAIRAAARLGRIRSKLRLVIAGGGRDDERLRRLADELDAPVTFLGRIPNADLPPLYGCADVFAMLCRNRWGGLEQEGFGIVFVEAASCGVPQVAGDSGGAAEAVADGETGYVIADPEDIQAVADAFASILDDDDLRRRMGERSRQRVLDEFAYDVLARRLGDTYLVTHLDVTDDDIDRVVDTVAHFFKKTRRLIEDTVVNLDPKEIAKFNALADQWWDRQGVYKSLHDINPLRLQYVKHRCPLEGRTVLDVACGAGILSESLAREGALVTGIDMAEAVLKAADLHARSNNLSIRYHQSTVEQWALTHAGQYDMVTCMELLEHVPDPSSIVRTCSRLVKPGGSVIFATLNRNAKSYLFAIIGAEYVLRLLPVGTHDWHKFIRPGELRQWGETAQLDLINLKGLQYNPFSGRYRLGGNLHVNYLTHFRKNPSASI